jgi:uncharacterized membrane protein
MGAIQQTDRVPATDLLTRVRDRLTRVTRWQLVLVAMIVGWTWYFTWLSLQIHHGLGTSAYDFGLYDQGVWLMSRFKAPFVTLMGRNLMGDHTSFILVFLVPFYWLFPAAGTLLFAQSLAVGMGALPIFLYARKRLESEAIAVALAAAYLLHPAIGWTNRENFHPDAFIGVFVGMAIYGALERKWRLYLVFVVLALLVKEDASLVLVPLGVWVAIKRDRRIGLLTVLGSVSFMLMAMFLVMRSLIGVPTRNGWRIPFGGPVGFLSETIERPGNVIQHFRSEGRPFYFWQMTMPFAWVFARAPSVALISLVVLGTNMLSTFWYQFHIEYHYSLVIVPAIALGTAYAIGHIREFWHRRAAVSAVVLMALWSAVLWGPLPIGRVYDTLYYWRPNHPSAVAARELIGEIPSNAVVSAYHSVTPQIDHRTQIYMFPNPFRVVLYGPNNDLERQRARLPQADQVQYVMLPTNLTTEMQADWDAVKADFTVLDSNKFWVLYQRSPG